MSLQRGLVLDLDISSEGLQGTTKFKDKTPYENNGTLSNVTLTTDRKGKANSAGLFNGTDSCVDCGNGNSLNVNNITISAWIYPTLVGGSRHYRILSKNSTTGYLFNMYSTTLEIYLGRQQVVIKNNMTALKWYHIVVTANSGGSIVSYIDGLLNTSTSLTGTINGGTSTLRVGADANNSFAGSIERPQIWNRALSADEVKLLYESYNPSLHIMSGFFIDSRDGIEYKTIKIGNQTWMAENLKYLPSVVGSATGSDTDPYYYVYGYQGTDVATAKATANYQTYGVLYNWTSATTACPAGWHLPSDEEFKTLEKYLGMTQEQANATGARGTDEGGKLKEAGLTHWATPNTGATNISGFTALPGGTREPADGLFWNISYRSYLWSSLASSSTNAWRRRLDCNVSTIIRDSPSKAYGMSVRCIRDY